MPGLFERFATAEELAAQWAAAWNAHDADRVLSFCSIDVTYVTYIAGQLIPNSNGTVVGYEAVGKLLRTAFALIPDLHFDVELVSAGLHSLILQNRSEQRVMAHTVLLFNNRGQIREAHAHYPR